jgi:hypothetical protein
MQSDVQITDVRLQLNQGEGRIPFEPLVEHLALELSSVAFDKIVRRAIVLFSGRLPVEIEIGSARIVNGDAEVVAKVKRSILKADLRARLTFATPDAETIRVRVAELDAPAWVPTQMVLDHGLTMATDRPGISKVTGDGRAVDLKPAIVLAQYGLPVKLATPGAWSISPAASSIGVGYSAD